MLIVVRYAYRKLTVSPLFHLHSVLLELFIPHSFLRPHVWRGSVFPRDPNPVPGGLKCLEIENKPST